MQYIIFFDWINKIQLDINILFRYILDKNDNLIDLLIVQFLQ